MQEKIEYKITPRSSFSIGLQELWQYRELFYFFTWRDVKVKYKHTVLGVLWAILQPLVLTLIFTFVFNKGLKFESNDLPYPLFIFSGLTIWQIFSGGLTNSANSILENSKIIQKIYFPRLIIPISSILAAVVDFSFAFIAMLCMAIYFQIQPNIYAGIGLLALSLISAIVATLGLSLFLSAWNVKYRDFQYVIPFLVQVLFFVSPVLYDPKQIGAHNMEWLFKLNPMSSSIHLLRSALAGAAVDWSLVAWSSAASLLLLGTGIIVFRRMEAYFADLV